MADEHHDSLPESSSATSIHLSAYVDPDGQASVPPADAEVPALQPGTALLRVFQGPNAGSRFLLDGEFTSAGRHPSSEIFLDDVTVSRKHAEFRRAADGFLVRDVGSLNGTYVNRERVDECVLQTGDEVQIGKFRLIIYLPLA
jgi:pSer/pThr/pTyr-binding forkhead associated (FHA) protein